MQGSGLPQPTAKTGATRLVPGRRNAGTHNSTRPRQHTDCWLFLPVTTDSSNMIYVVAIMAMTSMTIATFPVGPSLKERLSNYLIDTLPTLTGPSRVSIAHP